MDKATDVLSFAFHDFAEPFNPTSMELIAHKGKLVFDGIAGSEPYLGILEVPDLGDIYFGMPYVHEYCIKKVIPLEDELVVSSSLYSILFDGLFKREPFNDHYCMQVLATHGFAHLLGYDHETSMDDFKRMYLFEFDILRKFDWATGRNTLLVKEKTLDDGHC